jgi:hypothetical protein
MSIEQNYSIRFIASLALREKQIQQNYRPIIAVHKWFARRPGTLFRGLLLSEFGDKPVEETYYRANSFEGVTIADPFMGGNASRSRGECRKPVIAMKNGAFVWVLLNQKHWGPAHSGGLGNLTVIDSKGNSSADPRLPDALNKYLEQ